MAEGNDNIQGVRSVGRTNYNAYDYSRRQTPRSNSREPSGQELQSSYSGSREANNRGPQGQKSSPASNFAAAWKGGSDPASQVAPMRDQLAKDLGRNAQVINNIAGLDGKIPSTSELQGVFDEIKKDPNLKWNNLRADHAKAHMACSALKYGPDGEQRDINSAKITAKLPDAIKSDAGENPAGEKERKPGDRLMGKSSHTAALTFARDDKTGQVNPYVIDPALNSRSPMSPQDWTKKMWNRQDKLSVELSPASTYRTSESAETPSNPQNFDARQFDRGSSRALDECLRMK